MPAAATRRRPARTASDAIEDSTQRSRQPTDEPVDAGEDDDMQDEEQPSARSRQSKPPNPTQDAERLPFDLKTFHNQPLDKGAALKLKGVSDDWNTVAGSLKRTGFNAISEVAASMAEWGEGDEAEKALTQLDLVFRDLLDAKREIEIHSEVMRDFAAKASLGTLDNIEEQWQTDVKAGIDDYSSKTTRQKYAKDEAYLTYRGRVYEVKHPSDPMPPITYFLPKEEGDESDDDDDLEVGGVTQEYKCPITLTPLVKPLTAKCGHSFSAEAIRQYVGSGRGSEKKCPAAGCNAWIRLSELTEDTDLEKRAQAYARRLARAEAEDDDDDDDDDEVIE